MSCTDGVINGDETGVDCGGACSPCAVRGPSCDLPVQNSLTDCAGTAAGHVCHVNCNPGYVLSGTYTCDGNGQFSGGSCNLIPGAVTAGPWLACVTQDPSSTCTGYASQAECMAGWVQDGNDCSWEDLGHAPDPVGSLIISITLTIDIASVPMKTMDLGGIVRGNPLRFAWEEKFLGELASVMQCDVTRLRFDSANAASVIIKFIIFPEIPDMWGLFDLLVQAINDPNSPFWTMTDLLSQTDPTVALIVEEVTGPPAPPVVVPPPVNANSAGGNTTSVVVPGPVGPADDGGASGGDVKVTAVILVGLILVSATHLE